VGIVVLLILAKGFEKERKCGWQEVMQIEEEEEMGWWQWQ